MNNSIGPEGARAIAGVMTSNKRLKKINLFWNNIGNKGLEAICENLRKDYPRDFVMVCYQCTSFFLTRIITTPARKTSY
jgi:hypothetical protein